VCCCHNSRWAVVSVVERGKRQWLRTSYRLSHPLWTRKVSILHSKFINLSIDANLCSSGDWLTERKPRRPVRREKCPCFVINYAPLEHWLQGHHSARGRLSHPLDSKSSQQLPVASRLDEKSSKWYTNVSVQVELSVYELINCQPRPPGGATLRPPMFTYSLRFHTSLTEEIR